MKGFSHLIEPAILKQIDDLSELTFNHENLLGLTHNRFDLAFKLLFLQGLDGDRQSAFRETCYKRHIKAFSGRFSEPDNPEKNTYKQFESVFKKLFFSIKEHGFDANESLIPLAVDGSILNGAHRTSVAILLNKPVATVQTKLAAAPYDYQFFWQRGVPVSMLDVAAQTFAEFDDRCFLAAVWPAAKGYDDEIDALLSRVVYKKNVRLNYHGAHNLLAEAYQNEPWLGPEEKNLPGIKAKLAECFPNLNPVRVYLFRAEGIEQVDAAKKSIRAIFDIGNHAIHITNNQEETLRLGRLLFSENGVHFLNHGHPRELSDELIESLQERLTTRTGEEDDLLLDDELVMKVYGLRTDSELDCSNKAVEEKNNEALLVGAEHFYTNPRGDLADNPDNFFIYKGIKIISLQQVYAMKLARQDERDIADTELIKGMIHDNVIGKKWDSVRASLFYYRLMLFVKTKQFASKALSKAGLLEAAKKMFKLARKRD